MPESAANLRRRLRGLGLTEAAIDAAWPTWWTSEAESSASARADLRFSLARNLGLDPRTLVHEGQPPRFAWHGHARFKHLRRETGPQLDAINSFGRALVALLVAGTEKPEASGGQTAAELRQTILRSDRPFVGLPEVLVLCWSLGIPAAALRVFPLRQKRMAAMSVRVNDRFGVLIAKDSRYPAELAFYAAHELGHIWLSHLSQEPVLVDFEQDEPTLASEDVEEQAADAFALELLTGQPQPRVLPQDPRYRARDLAETAARSGPQLRIDPGVLLMSFGYSTKDWVGTYAALRFLYGEIGPVWLEVNGLAWSQLHRGDLPIEGVDFLRTVLGLS